MLLRYARTNCSFFACTGALVLLGSARRQSTVSELGGRAVPGEAAPAATAPARQRGAVLPRSVGRGAQRAEAVQRAEETRRPGTRRGQATGRGRTLYKRKFNPLHMQPHRNNIIAGLFIIIVFLVVFYYYSPVLRAFTTHLLDNHYVLQCVRVHAANGVLSRYPGRGHEVNGKYVKMKPAHVAGILRAQEELV